jgi:hypothetical protein
MTPRYSGILLGPAAILTAALAGLLLGGPAVAIAQSDEPATAPGGGEVLTFQPYSAAVLRTLDKVTARTSTMVAPVGETFRLGTLDVTVDACRKTPPEERPEAAAFLNVVDRPPDHDEQQVFSGWMFASSPGLSALEHPIYDVWVVDCKTADSASSSEGK